MLESQRGELDSIKASTGAALCSLKDDLEGLKASNGSNSELQSMLESQRGELDSIKASTGDSSKLQDALESLKDELEGLKASNGSNSELQSMLESQRGELDSIKAGGLCSTCASLVTQPASNAQCSDLRLFRCRCGCSEISPCVIAYALSRVYHVTWS
ncbi:unnamed protein product [Polarella glacialis]|uniref:Uncharacterized protein n=1 Tax=Polarella glacialis TaxID=89957 RepID=A0A813ISP8_POLGL|nr:unnamed protein product [Polarella glacialis]